MYHVNKTDQGEEDRTIESDFIQRSVVTLLLVMGRQAPGVHASPEGLVLRTEKATYTTSFSRNS